MADGLARIEHIVVLMMENRSFDNVLGYLSMPEGEETRGRARTDVDGLRPEHSNSHDGVDYPVHRFDHRPAITKAEDPSHSEASAVEQLADGNAGFVRNFVKTRGQHGHDAPADLDPGLVMGYYTAESLPVYDFLAESFVICDRWFSAVPGATFPNRLYALTGGSDEGRLEPRHPPLYRRRSFFRDLDRCGVRWRHYSYDPGLLHAIDPWYLLGPDDSFAFLENRTLLEAWNFFDDLAQKRLCPLSWLDPNFVDVGGTFGANDDHPPANVLAGQELVLRVYNAIRSSDYWERTLFVITYDEHGGFYDHVTPPGNPGALPETGDPPPDDEPRLRRYGVRVPAFVISPYTQRREVAHDVYDHTTLISTVLRTLCPGDADRIMAGMNRRVAAARDLGPLLTGDARPGPEPPEPVFDRIVSWHMETYREGLARPLPTERPWDLEDWYPGPLRKALRFLRDMIWRIARRRRLFPGLMKPEDTRLRTDEEDFAAQVHTLAKDLRSRGLPPGKP